MTALAAIAEGTSDERGVRPVELQPFRSTYPLDSAKMFLVFIGVLVAVVVVFYVLGAIVRAVGKDAACTNPLPNGEKQPRPLEQALRGYADCIICAVGIIGVIVSLVVPGAMNKQNMEAAYETNMSRISKAYGLNGITSTACLDTPKYRHDGCDDEEEQVPSLSMLLGTVTDDDAVDVTVGSRIPVRYVPKGGFMPRDGVLIVQSGNSIVLAHKDGNKLTPVDRAD